MAKTRIAELPPFTDSGATPEARMHWVQVPFSVVEGLYDEGTLKVQRNHLRRLAHASHLLKTNLPVHANFMATRSPEGALSLIDGYTRIAAVKEERRPRPGDVWLGVIDSDGARQVEQLYLAVDSRQAVKTGRDAFEEGLRKAGLLGKLVSPVFVNGYAVSAVAAASGESDTLLAVVALKRAIERLDPLKLEVGRFALPAGALAASLLLAQHEKELTPVLQFTAAVSRPENLSAADRKQVPGALKFVTWLAERREQGALSGRNVPLIMAQALGSFIWQQDGARGRIAALSRDEYLARG